MYDHIQPHKCNPPGCFREIIRHPSGNNRAIERATIMEHRFAFVFWMKWNQNMKKKGWLQQKAPTLVTIDWHRDLARPDNEMKNQLKALDTKSLSDAANFVWARFDQTNDGHIFCAAWLNLIGDIILLKNSAGEMQDSFIDIEGNEHQIYEFRAVERLEKFLQQRDDKNIFFDIDLDYFIHGKGNVFYPDSFEPYKKEEIKRIIDHKRPIFQYLLPRIDGFTIAQEPSYCGGIANSCRIMEVVDRQLFNKLNNWRHLSD